MKDEQAPWSWFISEVLDVSDFGDMGSPSWKGLVLFVSRAVSRRGFLDCRLDQRLPWVVEMI